MTFDQMRRSPVSLGVTLSLGLLIVAACSGNKSSGSTPDVGGDTDAGGADEAAAVTTSLTWHKDVRPIVETKCQGCHVPGGFAPFSLLTYADVLAHKDAVFVAVSSGIMPPWPPNGTCNTYQFDRSLTVAQKNAIGEWANGGAPEGDPSTYVAPKTVAAPTLRVDTSLSLAEAYTPVVSPDDYRCFVLDWNETTRKYVTGMRITPGVIAEVHHAIVFQIAPADVATVQQLDAADPAPGYSCFGGSGVNSAGWVGAWVPGTTGSVFPSDTGIAIEPGSKIVVQMHYNTASTKAAPDKSSVDLELADSVKIPAAVVKFTNPSWVSKHTMNIPAGDPDSVQSFSFVPSPYLGLISGNVLQSNMPFTIWSAGLHMHARGVKGTLTVTRPNGTKDCALEIDNWSFHWQGQYPLVKPIVVNPGDTVGIECHFDNSGKRQPIVNNEPSPVGPVNWGETTEDEMCLGIFYATQ